VWAGFHSNGKAPLVFIAKDPKIDSGLYQDLILDPLKKWSKKVRSSDLRLSSFQHFQHFGRRRWTLQQDWAPSHGSFRKTKKCPRPTLPYLQANFRKFWWRDTWPSCSPDLNPLDYSIWRLIMQKLGKRIYRSVKELERAIRRAWNEIPLEQCKKIVHNFPKRLQACIDAKGGHFEHLMKKERTSPEQDGAQAEEEDAEDEAG
jgi:hypothetical protein